MYEHRYKYGEQKAIMTVEEFRQKLDLSEINLEQKAFLVLLWHSGVRKSEAYERVNEDIKITDTHVIVDFHQRKIHGETVPPLKIPRKFYGVEEYLVPYLTKPKRFIGELVNAKILIHYKKIVAAIFFVLYPQEHGIHRRSLSQIHALSFLRLPRGSRIVTWPGEDAAYRWLKRSAIRVMREKKE